MRDRRVHVSGVRQERRVFDPRPRLSGRASTWARSRPGSAGRPFHRSLPTGRLAGAVAKCGGGVGRAATTPESRPRDTLSRLPFAGERDGSVDLAVVGQRRPSGRRQPASSRVGARQPPRASPSACSRASRVGVVGRAAWSAAFRSLCMPRDRRAKPRVRKVREDRCLKVAILSWRQRFKQHLEDVVRELEQPITFVLLERPPDADRAAVLVEITDHGRRDALYVLGERRRDVRPTLVRQLHSPVASRVGVNPWKSSVIASESRDLLFVSRL
jgi:hypothetical protein